MNHLIYKAQPCTWTLRGGVTTFDSHAMDHVMKFPRPSPFA